MAIPKRAIIGRKLIRFAIRYRMWAVVGLTGFGFVAVGAVAFADIPDGGVIRASDTTTTTATTPAADSVPIRVDFTQPAPDYQALNKHNLFTVGNLTVKATCNNPGAGPAGLAIWFHDNLAATLADWAIRGTGFVGPSGATAYGAEEDLTQGTDNGSDVLATDTEVGISQGGFVFRDASQVVTGQLVLRIEGPNGPCTVQGLAFASRHATSLPAGRAPHGR